MQMGNDVRGAIFLYDNDGCMKFILVSFYSDHCTVNSLNLIVSLCCQLTLYLHESVIVGPHEQLL